MRVSWLRCMLSVPKKTGISQKKEYQATLLRWRERMADDIQTRRSVAG